MTTSLVTGEGREQRPDLPAYYTMVRELAATEHLTLMDAEPLWSEIPATNPGLFEELVPDGVHPTDFAHCAITAPLLMEALAGCEPPLDGLLASLRSRAPVPCCPR